MTDKERLRRIKHLCYKYPIPFGLIKSSPSFKAITLKELLDDKNRDKEFKELIELLISNFKSEIDAIYLWTGIQRQKRINKGVYILKPIIPKQDNKNIRVGSGGK